jgi:hypothetical protein
MEHVKRRTAFSAAQNLQGRGNRARQMHRFSVARCDHYSASGCPLTGAKSNSIQVLSFSNACRTHRALRSLRGQQSATLACLLYQREIKK